MSNAARLLLEVTEPLSQGDYWDDEGLSIASSLAATLSESDWAEVAERWPSLDTLAQQRLAAVLGEVSSPASVRILMTMLSGEEAVAMVARQLLASTLGR